MDGFGSHRQTNGQSKQAPPGRLLGFSRLDALFAKAETHIALLRRCQPLNAHSECESAIAAVRHGRAPRFCFHYAAPPQLGAWRAALEQCQNQLRGAGDLAALYAERARELALEAELAEHIGTPRFAALARQRHSSTCAEAGAALAWALDGLKGTPVAEPAPSYASDDWRSAESLVRVLSRELGKRRLPWRIRVVSQLMSRAATGDGVLLVRARSWLRAEEAERIAAHEILGHAWPRQRARACELGLFRVGSAGAGADEEGRALLIEERLGHLQTPRRRELGVRHVSALALSQGADATECVRQLRGLGCEPEEAVFAYARSARGGGLCRELDYLSAWLRVRTALACDPGLERWLEWGRLSLDAARRLRALGVSLPATSS